jgi:hypothetical protein
MNSRWTEATKWTTRDELFFIAELRRRGNHRALANYIRVAPMRTWGIMDRDRILDLASKALERLLSLRGSVMSVPEYPDHRKGAKL